MSNMVINPDGTVTATVSVLFTGAVDALNTGTATLTITPEGGISTLSALLDGDPGQPANIRNVTVTMIAPNATGSGTATQVSPGGPGVPSVYDLALSIPSGAKGDPGPPGSVLGSGDINNAPADGQVLSYSSSLSKGLWIPNNPVTPMFVVPGTSYSSIAGTTGTASGVLVSLTIPAQSFRYRPRVEGGCVVTSAAGTRIDTEVRMGASTLSAAAIAASGTLIGRGRGLDSATAFHINTHPYFGVAMAPSDASPPAVVAPGAAQTIVFSAVRQTGTAAWSTSQTLAELRVQLEPA